MSPCRACPDSETPSETGNSQIGISSGLESKFRSGIDLLEYYMSRTHGTDYETVAGDPHDLCFLAGDNIVCRAGAGTPPGTI